MTAVVQLQGIGKKYKWFTALEDVSFELGEGEVFGYIGPNGAGKTTTLKILSGLITKFEGELRIAGEKIDKVRGDIHETIGFLPQAVGFQSWRTPDSALRTLGMLSGVAPDVLDRRMSELLERFDLAAVRHKKIKKLSGGMTQKLGVIQALLHDPKLLVFDEPLGGLDPVSRRLVKDIVRERRRDGATVIFSSHILSDVQDIADRVGIIHAGRMVTTGTLDQLKSEFGMPVDVTIQFSAPPTDTDFLRAHPQVERASERGAGEWLLRLVDDHDTDLAIHELVEQTLARGGRLRKIGPTDPNLDDLYAQYIAASTQEAHGSQGNPNPSA